MKVKYYDTIRNKQYGEFVFKVTFVLIKISKFMIDIYYLKNYIRKTARFLLLFFIVKLKLKWFLIYHKTSYWI